MSGYGMFNVYFDDNRMAKVWCRKDDIWAEVLQVCAEYNLYYHENCVVTKIELETESDDDE